MKYCGSKLLNYLNIAVYSMIKLIFLLLINFLPEFSDYQILSERVLFKCVVNLVNLARKLLTKFLQCGP